MDKMVSQVATDSSTNFISQHLIMVLQTVLVLQLQTEPFHIFDSWLSA